LRVIVADDDKDLMPLLVMGLRKHGIECVPAYDVMQAMMAAMQRRPDAILLDINMPGGGGLAALRRLKSSTRTDAIPVVAITASTDEKLHQEAVMLGAHECLVKPLDLEAVAQLIKSLVQPPQGG
jgi:DNA-binding response OmpR family regulator